MEVNVLADLLRMTQDHKHYVMLDPVLQEPSTVKSSYQLYNKKKVTIWLCVNGDVNGNIGYCCCSRHFTRRCKKFEYISWGIEQ